MTSRRRVAVLYTHLPHYRKPVFHELNGSSCYQFSFFYDPSGVDPTIPSGRVEERGIWLRTYRLGPFMFQPSFLPVVLKEKLDACILLGNPYVVTNWLYAVILRLRGCKVLMWTHGWLREEKGWKSRVRDIYYRLADSLLLYGNRAREIGMAKGFEPADLRVIYNSLDYDVQCSMRNQNLSMKYEGPQFLLCVTRLIPEVSLDMAIKALAILSQTKGRPVRLVVVGDGPERQRLEDQARLEKVDVVFLGAIYDEARLAQLFMSCAAVVSPGKVGLLAMHAMAYGAAIITHGDLDNQMPEVEAIVPNRTGSFFKRGDVHSLVDAMLTWLNKEKIHEEECEAIHTIESRYTPRVQRALIESALDDLFNAERVKC